MNFSFSEIQKFKKNWVWVVISIALFFTIKHSFYKSANYDTSRDIPAMMVICMVLIIIFIFTVFTKLKTRVDETGIYYQYVPLHREEILIRWSEIQEVNVRKYNPLIEYGGWGIKMGLFGKGRAYNIAGNMGLQIVYDNGKKLLLGTQKPGELQDILNKLEEAGVIVGKMNRTDCF